MTRRRGEPVSRRRFLALMAASGIGIGVGAACTVVPSPAPTTTPRRPRTASYRSRPDLAPTRLTVTTPGADAAPGLILTTPFAQGIRSGALIVDGTGEPVWFHPVQGAERIPADLRVQQLRGRPVLTWWEGVFDDGNGEGEFVIADGSYREVGRIRAGNGLAADLHELVLTPQGTALLMVYEDAVADLTALGGRRRHPIYENVVQEIDVETGAVLFEWRMGEHVPVTESYFPLGYKGIPNKRYDPFHLNSIQLDARGDLILSARHTFAIYKLSRASGEVVWRMGGKASDFSIQPRARFAWQHDARFHCDGSLTLFDNHAMREESGAHSRALLLAADEARRTVSLVREYVHPRGLLATSQANAQRLNDGGMLVGWGSKPYVTEFAADGDLRYDAHFDDGLQSYRAYRFEWTGLPEEAPAVAAEARGPGMVDVFASWNGATRTARWDVQAGPRADRLTTVGTGPRTGFETRLRCATRSEIVVAVARDAQGVALGASHPTRVRR